MGTLGAYLREAREAVGLDLRDAAQQTRISFAYLKAIEDEDFAKLPGEVFVKGFLKNYARFLRVPEDEVMRRYAELKAPGQGAAVPAAARAEASKPAEAPKHRRPAPAPAPGETRANLEPYLWGGALVIALVSLLLAVIPSRHASVKHPAAVATMPALTGGMATSPTPTRSPEKLYLDISALEDVWLLVRTDSSPQKKAVLRKGETVTWTADERFVLSFGSIGAVNLVLNGKELTVAGARNAVVRDLIVTASGITAQKTEPEQLVKPKPRVRTSPVPSVPATMPPPARPPVPEPVPVPAAPAQPAADMPVTMPRPEPAPAVPPPVIAPPEG